MKILIVSGIWPPDVGGPASHAPELAEWLLRARPSRRGADDRFVAAHAGAYAVHWVSRRLPPGVRHAAVAAAVARHARYADVVYATSMVGRTALGCLVARRPFVAKLTSDPAFERSHRRGLGAEDAVARALRAVRNWSVRRAAHVVCPSKYIAELAASWRGAGGISVLPNPAPDVGRRAARSTPPGDETARRVRRAADRRQETRRCAACSRATARGDAHRHRGRRGAATAGSALPGIVCGSSARDRAARCSACSRRPMSSVLPSAWENFPHAVGRGARDGNARGGDPASAASRRSCYDGENGVLVEAGDDDAFAEALAHVVGNDALSAQPGAGGRALGQSLCSPTWSTASSSAS